MTRPPAPPVDDASARIKVRLAEDAWNSREPEGISLAYTPDCRWRNRAEIFAGRNRIAVRFAYEYRDDSGAGFRAYVDAGGLIHRRIASINDLPITEGQCLFHWDLGARPEDHPGLTDLGL